MMPDMFLVGGGLLGALLLALFALFKTKQSQGRTEGKLEAAKDSVDLQNRQNDLINKQNEEVAKQNAEAVKTVEKTHEIHDRLNSDPDYAQRVRDRFTRPD